MESESKKPDIILNDKQKHPFELELHSRNLSSTAAKNVTSAQCTNHCLLSLHLAQQGLRRDGAC